MRQDLCELVVVLDRSGSMTTIRQDMEGGFDSFMREQAKVPGECRVSLYQFDDKYEVVYEGRPVKDVPACSLEPRGWTALVDAVCKTINATGARLSALPEAERPGKVVFLIITDGQENHSQEYNRSQAKALIEHQTNTYKWQFVYLGADASAFSEAQHMGVPVAAQYVPTARGTHALYDQVSASVMNYRNDMSKTASLSIPSIIPETGDSDA